MPNFGWYFTRDEGGSPVVELWIDAVLIGTYPSEAAADAALAAWMAEDKTTPADGIDSEGGEI